MRQASLPSRALRHRCVWLLWLALTLLPLTQSFAAWHRYSHDAASLAASESKGKHGAVHQSPCDICLAAAAVNGAPASLPLLALLATHQGTPAEAAESLWFAPSPRHYSSRAPPFVPY